MTIHINLPRIAIAAALCLTASATSAQEYRGSYQDQMACTPDVFRLCGQHMPDSTRITACLRENRSRLSGQCRAVFAAETNVAGRNADRRRGDQDRAPRNDGPPRYERQGPPAYDGRQQYGQPGYPPPYYEDY